MGSAKRSVLTRPAPWPPRSSGEVGAGKPTKLAPPLVVRTIDVQTGLRQGESPKSQNSLEEIAVNDTGSNPGGTGPPAGWPPAKVLGLVWLVAVVRGALPVPVVDVGLAPTVVEVAALEGVAVLAAEADVDVGEVEAREVELGEVEVGDETGVVLLAGVVTACLLAALLPQAARLMANKAQPATASRGKRRHGQVPPMLVLTCRQPQKFPNWDAPTFGGANTSSQHGCSMRGATPADHTKEVLNNPCPKPTRRPVHLTRPESPPQRAQQPKWALSTSPAPIRRAK